MSPIVSQTLSTAQTIIEIAATAAFALYGVTEAARERLNAVGVTVVACLATFAGGTLRSKHFKVTERVMLWPDGLGFGLFDASGTQIAVGAQMPSLFAVLMGMVTAVSGGVLRDVVCNEIRSAFCDHRPYAVCAFLGGSVVIGAEASAQSPTLALAAGALVATAFRLLAIHRNWRLPA